MECQSTTAGTCRIEGETYSASKVTHSGSESGESLSKPVLTDGVRDHTALCYYDQPRINLWC